MTIVYAKSAIKAIKRMDAATKRRIKLGIEGIPVGDIKPLKGSFGLYRLRIGNLRVLFSYTEEEVYIRNVIPRGDAYK